MYRPRMQSMPHPRVQYATKLPANACVCLKYQIVHNFHTLFAPRISCNSWMFPTLGTRGKLAQIDRNTLRSVRPHASQLISIDLSEFASGTQGKCFLTSLLTYWVISIRGSVSYRAILIITRPGKGPSWGFDTGFFKIFFVVAILL